MKLFIYVEKFICSFVRALRQPRFQAVIFIIAVLSVLGMIFYVKVEKMSVVDGFYFTVMTLTTIGYGDVVPVTDVGKIFTSIYSVLGVGILFAFIAAVAKTIQDKGACKLVKKKKKK